jgi:hypothetical protein
VSAEVAAADGRGEVRLREAADGWNEEAGWDEAEASAVLDLAEASLRASDCMLIASLISARPRRVYERPPRSSDCIADCMLMVC